MKVLYAIYSKKGTPGGHFFSLEHLLYALSENVDISVLFIGKNKPVVIQELPFKCYQVEPNSANRKTIVGLLSEIAPNVIHCYDDASYKLLSYYTLFRGYKILFTKAGGPSSKFMFHFPYCKDYILFSQENLNSMKNNIRFIFSNLYLIPNRVNIELLKETKVHETEEFTFVQVIRLSNVKHSQIEQSLSLMNYLKQKQIRTKLILAGTVNDEEEKNRVEKYIEDNGLNNYIQLITDQRVNRGSDMLQFGDCVIGTGRSVMEAVCMKKLVLVPNAETDYPVLLDSDNFDDLLSYNFSGRSTIVDSGNENKILRLLLDSEYRSQLHNYTNSVCQKYFLITKDVVQNYLNIYNNLKKMNSIITLVYNIHIFFPFIIKDIKG